MLIFLNIVSIKYVYSYKNLHIYFALDCETKNVYCLLNKHCI